MSRPIKTVARVGERTKELATRVQPGEIVIISHQDLDEVAAASLYDARVAAVINVKPFVSGRYPNSGPLFLLERGVYLFQALEKTDLRELDGVRVELDLQGKLTWQHGQIYLQPYTKEQLETDLAIARENLNLELAKFVANTLEYAQKELGLITGAYPAPKIKHSLQGKHVLVVVRGKRYQEDLAALASYIDEVKPVLIGVDGGADALRDLGWRPDIIVGDMDSVSDETLQSGAELIVHGYVDGRAPGVERLRALGLTGHVWHIPGTSEDLALLLAYDKGAKLIVAVGTHSNMIDFLDKGRPGMGSTFLVRLKVGEILVDAKGVDALYSGKVRTMYLIPMVVAAAIPLLVLLSLAEPLRSWSRLLLLYLQASLGF